MKKVLLVVLALVLVAALSVGLTVAYLTSQDSVTNTFTVGKVEITLDEAKVNVYGVKDGDTRVAENTYKLIPGHSYVKDPTVHVAADSEECWLFVKVENGLAGAEASGNTSIAAQMKAIGWELIDESKQIYAYNTKVSANTDVKVFESFKLAGSANVAQYTNANIKVTAYAVQADTFESSEAALTAAPFPATN